jgi:heme O synthase-like polyprenyltransferase
VGVLEMDIDREMGRTGKRPRDFPSGICREGSIVQCVGF